MKKILRIFSIEVAGLFITTQIAAGIVFQDQLEGMFITGIALALAIYIVKPVVNVLLLPLNLITLNMFKFFSHAITLFIVDYSLPHFEVVGFHFPGLVSRYLDLPPIDFGPGVAAYIAFSIVLSVITSLLG